MRLRTTQTSAAATPPRAGGWLLLVEDNPYEEALAMRAFHKSGLGASIVVARDGVEALGFLGCGDQAGDEPAADAAELPRLVLLDLRLPNLDGFEVLRRMRARRRTRLIPVVVLSSSAEREDLHRCYALGANSYIQKPVDFAELVVTAGHLGAYWMGLNQPAPFGAAPGTA